MAVAVFPAPLSTEEFPEELPVEGQGRRKVLRVLEQSFGDLPAGTFSFPQHELAFFPKAYTHLRLLTRSTLFTMCFGVWLEWCQCAHAFLLCKSPTGLLKWCFRQDEQPWILYQVSRPLTEGRSTNPVAQNCWCAVLQSLSACGLVCAVMLCTINWKTRPWLLVFAKQSSAKVVFSSSGPWHWRALQFLNLSCAWLASSS